ncbi:metal-dependent hydrolase [Acinetobacter guillouiae]|uniref:HD domain-containing protein n=1 Tax=Acinetobacter guillouiae TaxID=106649 RepID=UPI002E1FCC94
MIIAKTENYLKPFNQYWAEFANQIEIETEQCIFLQQLLVAAYTEPLRHYHTVQHIVECLELFHQVKAQLNDPVAVELAIWFHDAVYNPQAKDNEQQSAQLMHKHCVGILTQSVLDKVSQWIIATQKHQPSKQHDLNYLLDIDLAILASPVERFAEYEQQIQQEYAWVDAEIYKVKRAEVLQHFFHMQPLYQTEYFRKNFEQNAKVNLSKL